MRKFFVGGNWKCNGTVESVKKLVADLNASVEKIPAEAVVDVVVAPQTLHIPYVAANIAGRYGVSAQNCYIKAGAFTGELSAPAAADFGLKWTLLGHSERRHIFGETDKLLTEKTTAALENGLNIIFCIGELLADHPVRATFIAALVGLIPNCGASVALTELFLDGTLAAGPMIAGLLVSGGVGLLVLWRTNADLRQNAAVTGVVYAVGVAVGLLVGATGMMF